MLKSGGFVSSDLISSFMLYLSKIKCIRTALRLSSLLVLFWILTSICFAASAGASEHKNPAFPIAHNLDFLFKSELNKRPELSAGLVVIENNQTQIFSYGEINSSTELPLLRINELFTSLALLAEIDAHKANLDDPINYHLPEFRILQPFGDVTLRHILTHSTGLPWRQGGLYATESKYVPKLNDLVIQELTPPVIAPDRAISFQSISEPLMGLILSQLSQQPLHDLIPQFAQQQYGFQLKLAKGVSKLNALDKDNKKIQQLLSASPDLHGYTSTLQDMAQGLAALQKTQTDSRWRLNLFSSKYFEHDYYHLDSLWLGYQQRLAVIPEKNLIYYFFSNQIQAELNTQILSSIFSKQEALTASKKTIPADIKGSYVRINRNKHSLLKVLDIFDFIQLKPQARGIEIKYQGQHTLWQSDQNQWVDTQSGAAFLLTPDAGSGSKRQASQIRFLSDQHQTWEKSTFKKNPKLHWLIASIFAGLFFSILIRGGLALYHYEPELKNEPEETDNLVKDIDLETPRAGWDIPFLGTLGAVLGLLFMGGIYPVLMCSGKVGDELSLVVRNQPSGWLLGWLAMPLFTMVSALILLALLAVEWKNRPWQKWERWHYLSHGLLLILWCAWLASWNLLGFRF